MEAVNFLKLGSGVIINMDEEFHTVEIESDVDLHITVLDQSCCLNFNPKIGDKVMIKDTGDDWAVELDKGVKI